MTPEQRRRFVREHRTGIFGYNRKRHGPAMTIVYYAMDGDDILVSTMADREKARAVGRNAKVSLCILDEQWPPTYVQVYCDAVVEREEEQVVDLMMRVAGVMAGSPMPETVRPMVREGARNEGRVVLRLTPYATFHTPPRHVNNASDVAGLTHETSASVAWSG